MFKNQHKCIILHLPELVLISHTTKMNNNFKVFLDLTNHWIKNVISGTQYQKLSRKVKKKCIKHIVESAGDWVKLVGRSGYPANRRLLV